MTSSLMSRVGGRGAGRLCARLPKSPGRFARAPVTAPASSALKWWSRPRQSGEAFVQMAMVTIMVGESRFREKSPRSNEAVERPPRSLVPSNIECKKLREELNLAVRQVVVNPPGHCLPRCSHSRSVDQPRHDDRRQSPHSTILAASIPDVTRTVLFVRGATQSMFAPKVVDLRRAIRRSNGEAA